MGHVKRHTINYPTRGSKINIIHSTLNEHRHHSVAAPHTGLLSFFRAIRYHNVVLRGLNDEEDQTMKLNDAMQHFSKLYGRRNRIFLPSLRDRIDFLNLAIGDLQDAVRKGVNEQLLGVALARVISRIFCIAEHFQELDIAWAMARKYGPDFCIYCRKEACACLERRNNVKPLECAEASRLSWSLQDWCNHLKRTYGTRNKEKGIENVINRLFKEVCEFLSLSMSVGNGTHEGCLETIEDEYAFELADTLAWTIAISNLLEIDLEAAILTRYGDGCAACCGNPCRCTRFGMAPVRWKQQLV